MIRTTTPTHQFHFCFDIMDHCEKVLITYVQNGKIVLVKNKNDLIDKGDNLYEYTLTQKETAMFEPNKTVYVEIKVKTDEGKVMASEKYPLDVDDVLNDEEM